MKTRKKQGVAALTYRAMPADANILGNVHGGQIMHWMDNAAGAASIRLTRRPCVTASVDRVDFLCPVHVGDLVEVKGSVNFVGRTSMEVGVRVEAENIFTGEVRHTASAYFTMVALDADGRPTPLPPWTPKNKESKRRWEEASIRRQQRLANRARIKR